MPETTQRRIERAIGAVLVPEVRSPGTPRAAGEVLPPPEYLRRFPPAGVVVFGRTLAGAISPTPQLERVRALCQEEGESVPFACCDLEQGAGLHFADATRLPPALALAAAAAGDPDGEAAGLEWIRRAGECTGVEARARGVELVLAPVADVNTCRNNPIVSVRSFGDEPAAAGRRARALAQGLRRGGAGACLKHFPGHGDTAQDSHIGLPRVDRDRSGLEEIELAPFAVALAAQPEAVMVAHLDVPALSGSPGTPATLSGAVIALLREHLGFRGAVLSDAMDMGALEKEPRRYLRALVAGCDGLLCPHDPLAAAEELLAAARAGTLPLERLEAAAECMHALRCDLRQRPPLPAPDAASASDFAQRLGAACLVASPGPWPWIRGVACELLAPIGACGPETRAGLEWLARELAGGAAGHTMPAVLPVVCELGAWKGRYGIAPAELDALRERLGELRARRRPAAVLALLSPQVLPASLFGEEAACLLAFSASPPMLAAAGLWLRGQGSAGGSLPARLG